MRGDGENSGRNAALTALSGGVLGSGGPAIMLVMAALVFASLDGTHSTAPPPVKEEARNEQPEDVDSTSSNVVAPFREEDVTAALRPLWKYLENPTEVQNAAAGTVKSGPTLKPMSGPSPWSGLAGLDVQQVVIAMLPDPVETGSKYEFDMGLEAIQKAIESEGYLIDCFNNPWGNFGPRTGQPAPETREYQRLPACVIFRAGDDELAYNPRRNLTLLLVVGESNTSGMHPVAMRTALECAKALTPLDARRRRTIRIVGPTYSGTAEALARILSRWLDDNPECNAWVCSGSATGVEKGQFEGLAAPTKGGSKPGRVIYSATVLPDDLTLIAALEHLRDPARGQPYGEPDKTVFLVESGTLLGNQIFRRIDELNQRHDFKKPFTFIPFPRRLAQIRDISDLSEGINLTLKSAKDLPLAEKGQMKEIFPVSDPAMTQWSDREIVTHILSTITGEDARNVGILASEVRNVLALVKLVNRYCPDVQIFLINNDLLFTYDTFAAEFYGAVIASSYPLDSRTQNWSFPANGEGIRRLLSNETDLGRYNACLVLLNAEPDPRHEGRLILRGQAEDMLVYGPPFADVVADRTNSGSGAPSRPCVWINLVGQNETWPVRALDLGTFSRQGCPKHEPSLRERLDLLRRKLRSRTSPKFTLSEHEWARRASHLASAARTILEGLPGALDGAVEPAFRESGDAAEMEVQRRIIEDSKSRAAHASELSTLRLAAEDDARTALGGTDGAKGDQQAKDRPRSGPSGPSARSLMITAIETIESEAGGTASQDRLRKLSWAAYQYYKFALIYQKANPLFERERKMEGTAVYRFETELAWIEALSHLPIASGDLLRTEQALLAAELAELAPHIEQPDPSAASPPRETAIKEQLARILKAGLECSTSLRSLTGHLARLDNQCGCDETDQSPEEAPLHKRWTTYRMARSVLGGAIEHYHKLLEPNKPTITTGIRGILQTIDDAISPVLNKHRRSERNVERTIEALAEASERVDQARKAQELIPPVFNVELQYLEAISAIRPPDPANVAKPGSVVSILSELPWLYHVSLVVWMILAAVVTVLILLGNKGQNEETPRNSWFALSVKSDMGKGLYLRILIMTLFVILGLVSRPMLVILSGAECLLCWELVAIAVGSSLVLSRLRSVERSALFSWTAAAVLLVVALVGSALLMPRFGGIESEYWLLIIASGATLMDLLVLGNLVLWMSRPRSETKSPSWESLAAWGPWLILEVAAIFMIWTPTWRDVTPEDLYTATRLPFLSSGVSPLPTAMFLAALYIYWCLNRLRTIECGRRLPPRDHVKNSVRTRLERSPAQRSMWCDQLKSAADTFESLGSTLRTLAVPRFTLTGLRDWLKELLNWQGILMVVVLAALLITFRFGSLWRGRFNPTPEGQWYDTLLLMALYAYLFLYLEAFCLLGLAWGSLRRLLETLETLPLQAALNRLPIQVCQGFGRFTGGAWESERAENSLRLAKCGFAGEVARGLNSCDEDLASSSGGGVPSQLHHAQPRSWKSMKALHEAARGPWDQADPETETRAELLAWECLPFVVTAWDRRDPRETFGHAGSMAGDTGNARQSAVGNGTKVTRLSIHGKLPEHGNGGSCLGSPTATVSLVASRRDLDRRDGVEWLELAEDFVLISLLVLLKRYSGPIRSLSAFLMCSPVLLLFAVTSYPFQPQRMLTMAAWALVLAALAITSWIFIQIDRDPFVSRVSRTTPYATTFDVSLLTKLLPMLVPVFGLILSAFPKVGFTLRSILEPLGQALK